MASHKPGGAFHGLPDRIFLSGLRVGGIFPALQSRKQRFSEETSTLFQLTNKRTRAHIQVCGHSAKPSLGRLKKKGGKNWYSKATLNMILLSSIIKTKQMTLSIFTVQKL